MTNDGPFKFAAIEKTDQQKRMEAMEKNMQEVKPSEGGSQNIELNIPLVQKPLFTNNKNVNNQFKPIEKTSAQLKMEELERKEAEEAKKRAERKQEASNNWLGKKPQTEEVKPAVDESWGKKTSGWVTSEVPATNQEMKFKPINNKDKPKIAW